MPKHAQPKTTPALPVAPESASPRNRAGITRTRNAESPAVRARTVGATQPADGIHQAAPRCQTINNWTTRARVSPGAHRP